MILFSLVCLILCMGYGVAEPASEYVYSREVDAWLRLHTEPASFWDASANCQREDGVLASPTTDEIVQAMHTTMGYHKLNTSSSSVFAGIAAQVKGDRFPSIFSNVSLQWAAGEHSDTTDEQCLALTGAGALANVSCSHAYPYFCRKEPIRKCGDRDNGYEWDTLVGSCFKFHRQALPFRQALARCHSEGAHLTVINSSMESCALRRIFDNVPEDSIVGSDDRSHALVGFRKYEDGQWGTMYGYTLYEAGFSQWSPGEPNNAGGNEFCGSIAKDGLLNDISCTKPVAFICEKHIRPKPH